MSILLIALVIVLVIAFYARLVGRARSTARAWARRFGYRLVSARYESAFDEEHHDLGRYAEVVYRVELATDSGERHAGYLLMWGLLVGHPDAVIHWDRTAPRP
jgi:hypothetical protein